MKCPRCETALSISDRQGIEIDFCPQCRGVWLDRGELDKIVERASRYNDDDDDRREDRRDDRHEQYSRPPQYDRDRQYHKRKSFWHELFD